MEKIKKLKKILHDYKIDGYLIPKNDEFFSEYTSEHEDRLKFLTGFTGSYGFALILKEDSPISRRDLVKVLAQEKIECRPIVTGNFLKNTEVLSYFDYEISGTLENSEHIDSHGFFVGNHQIDLTMEIDHLYSIISQIMDSTAGS